MARFRFCFIPVKWIGMGIHKIWTYIQFVPISILTTQASVILTDGRKHSPLRRMTFDTIRKPNPSHSTTELWQRMWAFWFLPEKRSRGAGPTFPSHRRFPTNDRRYRWASCLISTCYLAKRKSKQCLKVGFASKLSLITAEIWTYFLNCYFI